MIKTVSVIGLGYIGLPTALLFAKSGLSVRGFDVSKEKINSLQKGILPFDEKGLDTLLKAVNKKNTFKVSQTLQSADAYLIAVPTPQQAGKADLRYVLKALASIKKMFQDGQLIIIESTVGPRDCLDIIIPVIQKWHKKFGLVHCPERAIPGNTLHEMIHNDRIIGAEQKQDAERAQRLYQRFVKGSIHLTTTTIAASTKVMENTYRALNIALANEFAQLAETLKFDVWEAIELANKHPRVNIHQPGPGVGGHCIPIDPWFFVSTKRAPLIKKALLINERRPHEVVKTIKKLIRQKRIVKPTIGILGYAYKKNVDDSRETPAKTIITQLKKTYPVLIHDPHVTNIEFVELETLLKTATVIVLVTDHDEYKNIDFKKYSQLKLLHDTRHILNTT